MKNPSAEARERLRASVIFYETLHLLRLKQRRIVHQGGQNSGKTVNILISIAVYLSENPGTIATVTAKSFPVLKAGALRDFEMYAYPHFTNDIKQYHHTERTFTWWNGSILEFKTYETEAHARGAKRQVLFINEANTFDYMTYFQLDSRSDITILDYNPSVSFWCHEKVIGDKNTAFRISDHRHNPFLSREKHLEIEEIKDEELFKVYARGLTGNVQGVIFPNWTPIENIPEFLDNICFGIDYGYTNDPTTIMKVVRQGNKLYIDELEYKIGSIPPRVIKTILTARGYTNNYPLYSEHDPDMIRQIKMLGVTILGARKDAGSINAGIEKLKEFEVFYTARSKNLKNELSKYIWITDDKTGKLTNVPIDAHNHCIDAIRYAVYTHFYKSNNAS